MDYLTGLPGPSIQLPNSPRPAFQLRGMTDYSTGRPCGEPESLGLTNYRTGLPNFDKPIDLVALTPKPVKIPEPPEFDSLVRVMPERRPRVIPEPPVYVLPERKPFVMPEPDPLVAACLTERKREPFVLSEPLPFGRVFPKLDPIIEAYLTKNKR